MKLTLLCWIFILFSSFSVAVFAQENVSNGTIPEKPELIIQSKLKLGLNGAPFSPDGKFFITTSRDGFTLWDFAGDVELRNFDNTEINTVAFSPDSKLIVSGGFNDGTVKIWDISTGEKLISFKGHKFRSIDAVLFSPDGKKVASCSGNELKLWDIITQREASSFLGHPEKAYITSIGFSSDGKYIFSGSWDKTIKMWDASTGAEIRSFIGHESGSKNADRVLAIAVSGNSLLVSGDDEKVILWDINTGKELRRLATNGMAVTISPDRKYVYTMTPCRKWDVSSGKMIKSFNQAGIWSISSALFSPDCKFALTKYLNVKKSEVKIWDVEKEKVIREFTPTPNGGGVTVMSHDGKYVFCGSSDNAIRVWDINQGKLVQTLSGTMGQVLSMAISPDGKYLLTGSKYELLNLPGFSGFGSTLNLWDVTSGKLIKSDSGTSDVVAAAFSTDGMQFIASPLGLWDVKSFTMTKSYNIKFDDWGSIRFTPDGNAFIVATEKILKLIDVKSGQEILRFELPTSYDLKKSIAFSPDGTKLLSGSWNQTMKLWDMKTGKELQSFSEKTEDLCYYSPVAFSPDGKYVASANSLKEILLWNASSGELKSRFKGHSLEISSLVFTPDSKRIISGSKDASMRVWDLETNSCVTFLSHRNMKDWVIYTADGYWEASKNGGELMVMVKGTEYYKIDQFAMELNRPDILITQLGSKDTELIAYYYNQYIKRSKKMNVANAQSSVGFNVPTVKLISAEQKDKFMELSFTLSDTKYDLKSYNVFVNNVPIYGATGKNAQGKSLTKKEAIELTDGPNKIEVSCTNVKGMESYRVSTSAIYVSKGKPDLYFLAFGVSKYKNPDLNLKYADKDATDLASVLEGFKNNGFNNVFTKVYTNEQVTAKAISEAKSFVKNAKPDDTFILFIAGHGLHDTNTDATYYFLTYNADLNNLQNTAANFEAVEDLLQGIPQRFKLFLMDACESGELDGEDQGQMMVAAAGLGIASRGFKSANQSEAKGNQLVTKQKLSLQKDRYIFNNLDRRSGAIVFSSSKGGELSYERSDIENGLFTEYIINALTTKEADSDKNGVVSVFELNDYVSTEVAKATGDLQHPVIDRDNYFLSFGFQTLTLAEKNKKNNKPVLEANQILDPRDDQIYNTIQIGNQKWLAQNMNYDAGNGSFCYDNSIDNCKLYGRLYTWEMAKSACPDGWHLPSAKEWQMLVDFVGGEKVSEIKLKTATDWKDETTGTNEYGFNAMPGGFYDNTDNTFYGQFYRALFWSSTPTSDPGKILYCQLYNINPEYPQDKINGLSVRCIKEK